MERKITATVFFFYLLNGLSREVNTASPLEAGHCAIKTTANPDLGGVMCLLSTLVKTRWAHYRPPHQLDGHPLFCLLTVCPVRMNHPPVVCNI